MRITLKYHIIKFVGCPADNEDAVRRVVLYAVSQQKVSFILACCDAMDPKRKSLQSFYATIAIWHRTKRSSCK